MRRKVMNNIKYTENEMLMACEYGYVQHEKGNNLEKAKNNLLKILGE
jgi:hypothetical protein